MERSGEGPEISTGWYIAPQPAIRWNVHGQRIGWKESRSKLVHQRYGDVHPTTDQHHICFMGTHKTTGNPSESENRSHFHGVLPNGPKGSNLRNHSRSHLGQESL